MVGGEVSGRPRRLGGTVPFAVAPDVAFDYLSDPRNRPQWQSSLRRVDDVRGEPGVGQAWIDVTIPGLRPVMSTTVFERPHAWSEVGTWRLVRASLELRLAATDTGCDVAYAFRIDVAGPLGLAATAVSLPAVRADLRRAARLLAADRQL